MCPEPAPVLVSDVSNIAPLIVADEGADERSNSAAQLVLTVKAKNEPSKTGIATFELILISQPPSALLAFSV